MDWRPTTWPRTQLCSGWRRSLRRSRRMHREPEIVWASARIHSPPCAAPCPVTATRNPNGRLRPLESGPGLVAPARKKSRSKTQHKGSRQRPLALPRAPSRSLGRNPYYFTSFCGGPCCVTPPRAHSAETAVRRLFHVVCGDPCASRRQPPPAAARGISCNLNRGLLPPARLPQAARLSVVGQRRHPGGKCASSPPS